MIPGAYAGIQALIEKNKDLSTNVDVLEKKNKDLIEKVFELELKIDMILKSLNIDLL